METLKEGLKGAGMLAAVGLIAGGICGWLSLLFTGELKAAADFAAKGYWSLALLLPLTTALLLVDDDTPAPKPPASPTSILLIALITAVAGAIFATLLFLVVATNVLAIFKGLDAGNLSDNLRADIGWAGFGVVGLITLGAGLVVFWRKSSQLKKV